MKKKLFVTIVLSALMLMALTSTAYAKPIKKYLGNGCSVVTTIEVKGKTTYRNAAGDTYTDNSVPEPQLSTDSSAPVRAYSIGYGGYSAYSGSRYAKITSRYYWGSWNVITWTTPYYFEFYNRRITRFNTYGSQWYCAASLFFYWVGEKQAGPYYSTYANHYNGQAYAWKRATIEYRITKWGVLNCYYPFHEFWARCDGTYVWNNH